MTNRLLRRGTALATVLVPMVAMTAVVVPADSALAGSTGYTNACRNSVLGTNWDQINVTSAMTSPTGPVAAGSSVPLTGISLDMSIPGAIFVTGYNLGLLTKGANSIPTDVHEVIDATNTVQGSQPTATVSTSLSTTITDPDGTAGTGDETATDAVGSASFPNLTWTAKNGNMAFAEHNDSAITGAAGGGIVAVAHVGAISATFHCTSGSVQNPGNPAPPAVVTFSNAPVITTTLVKATADRTRLTLAASATTVRKGATVRFRGRLQDVATKAYVNGQRVALQRRFTKSGPWRNVTSALTRTVSGKKGSVVFPLKVTRSSYYRLSFRGTTAYRASRSPAVHVVVR